MRPNHVGITMHGIIAWAQAHNVSMDLAYRKGYSTLNATLQHLFHRQTPIVSVLLIPEERKASPHYSSCIEETAVFLQMITKYLHQQRVKISVLGKWYDVPKLIDPIKQLIDQTQQYDRFFLNLCINYNGNEEILDATRLIARKVAAGKLDADNITKETMKENIYSSAFLPPDIIIKSGVWREVTSFLLWDSTEAYLHITAKPFPDLTIRDVDEAIHHWQLQEELKS